MTSHACKQVGFDERIYGKPIHFELGTIHADPEVLKYLEAHGVSLDGLLAKHERLIPSEAMESTDHYQNLAAAPKKQMVLSVYQLGIKRIRLETNGNHMGTTVEFEPALEEVLHRHANPLKNLLRNLICKNR